MKKWTGGVLIIALALILFLSYTLIGKSESSKKQSAYDFFKPQPVKEEDPDPKAGVESTETKAERPQTTKPKPHLRNLQELDDLYNLSKNLSRDNPSALLAWGQMKFLFPRSDVLPETDQGIKEALVMCRNLLHMIDEDKSSKLGDATMAGNCPSFVSESNATLLMNESSLEIPCGLVEDSYITVIGVPDTLQGSFQIELIGSQIEGLKPPIVLQYNVLLPGENLTKEPVIIQNAWTQESGWGKEERCPDHGPPDLLKGNNFERRMAMRRTWMLYDVVRSGEVVVRFFTGLHKNKDVNLKLWREAEAYGDIQLMPFVDYYNLLTYKTVAICIMGSKIVPTSFIMKMDDDAFVSIDEVVSSLKGKGPKGIVYGRISFDSTPHRDKDNKRFISEEEWPHSMYPPWAHGPGYIVSEDIVKFVVKGHKERDLTLFKLEDVGVGIWIEQYEKKGGQKIEYVNEERFNNAGCEADYILAHYQNPRMILCLWKKLLKDHKPDCCNS